MVLQRSSGMRKAAEAPQNTAPQPLLRLIKSIVGPRLHVFGGVGRMSMQSHTLTMDLLKVNQVCQQWDRLAAACVDNSVSQMMRESVSVS